LRCGYRGCNGWRHWLRVARADGTSSHKQRQLAGAVRVGWVQLLVRSQLHSALLQELVRH
jgi:hypothetical protein